MSMVQRLGFRTLAIHNIIENETYRSARCVSISMAIQEIHKW